MRTGLAVRDSGIILSASVAMGHGRDGFNTQFASFEHGLFVCRPTPTVRQVLRHDGRYFAYIHHHDGDMLYPILLRCFLHVANDIKDNT